MAYKRQNFADGDLLTADKLNQIEDGIVANEENASKSVKFEYQLLTDTQKKQVRTNIGAIGEDEIPQGIDILDSLPESNARYRGKLVILAENSEDKLCVCLRVAGTYKWFTFNLIGVSDIDATSNLGEATLGIMILGG